MLDSVRSFRSLVTALGMVSAACRPSVTQRVQDAALDGTAPSPDAALVAPDAAAPVSDAALVPRDGGATASDADAGDAGPAGPTGLTRSMNLACADPSIDRDGDTYYVVCTGRDTRYYTSRDLRTWEGHDMSIEFPSWVDTSRSIWAYELEQIGGRWYLYFAGPDRTNPAASGFHRSIGVVEAASLVPGVRFTAPRSLGDAPLVRRDAHSLIDPFVFQDPAGGLYIYYNQTDSTKTDSGLYVNRLSDPVTKECCARGLLGAAAATTPTPRGGAWTGTTLEAPAVFARDGRYYLLFSGNLYVDERYATGLARADSPLGPFIEARDDPQLDCTRMVEVFGGRCLMGPGGASVSPDGALVFHARMATDAGRWVYAGVLGVGADGWPTIE
jgi:GH43 family beta-xylosidase